MEVQAIIDAMKANPELISGVLPTIKESEVGKRFINTQVTAEVDKVIDDKIKSIHQRYDDDMNEILGERPERSDDGSKEKTYQKIKSLYGELKELRGQKDSLSKDTKVAELTAEIDRLKTEGPAKQIQEQFETAKSTWKTEKETLLSQIQEKEKATADFQKLTFINEGLGKIKFDPDTKDSIKNMVIENERQRLLSKSEIREGKLVFLDDEGKVELNKSTFEPLDVHGKLTSLESIRDISLKDEKSGGNAKTDVPKVQITTVEGKDAKKLNLSPGSFKTKSEFIQVAEKALTDAGITRRNPEWRQLQDAAYQEHKVSELPAE